MYQALFSAKNRNKIWKYHLLQFLGLALKHYLKCVADIGLDKQKFWA